MIPREHQPPEPPGEEALFSSRLDHERNVLLCQGDPAPLRRDLELHLLSIGVVHDPLTMTLLGDGLAALALYMSSRPRFETMGWTISLQDPLLNLFFTGSVREGTVVGRAFGENVRPSRRNRFFAQVSRPFGESQTSSVEVDGIDIFGIVEEYCSRSDQQPTRFFHDDLGRAALLAVLPDGDLEWFHAVRSEEVFSLEEKAGVKLIGRHTVTFLCGCDADRITRTVVDLFRKDPEDLFRREPAVEVECNRCGARYSITREAFERMAG